MLLVDMVWEAFVPGTCTHDTSVNTATHAESLAMKLPMSCDSFHSLRNKFLPSLSFKPFKPFICLQTTLNCRFSVWSVS